MTTRHLAAESQDVVKLIMGLIARDPWISGNLFAVTRNIRKKNDRSVIKRESEGPLLGQVFSTLDQLPYDIVCTSQFHVQNVFDLHSKRFPGSTAFFEDSERKTCDYGWACVPFYCLTLKIQARSVLPRRFRKNSFDIRK